MKMELKDKTGFPYPFSIECYTLNRYSKTGGELKKYDNATLLTSNSKKNTLNHKSLLIAAQLPSKPIKKPNHFKNRTRNIQLENGEIKKINIRLITRFNEKNVHY